MDARLLHITTIPMSLTFLRGQVSYMERQGFRVHVISSPGTELQDFLERERVTGTTVPMQRRITPLRDLLSVTRLLSEMRRIHPTIVHAHTPKGGLLGMIASTLVGAPVRIYQLRGLPCMGASGWRRRLLRRTEWLACRLAHQVLCVSASVREEAVRQAICPPTKIKVLLGGSGNGVDANGRFDPARQRSERGAVRGRFGIPAAATVIGFVGRVVRDKGVVELVEAWEQLRDAYPDLRLLLVGPFEAQDPIPARAERTLREDPRVHLAGLDWNTPPLYAAMDLVALPTYREGFPNVPLEAAAMSLPVVATRIPGCVDAVVDGVTGTLVAPRAVAPLREALRSYLESPELRLRHGAQGRARVLREFGQEAIWGAIHEEYQRLLCQQGGALVPAPIHQPDRTAPAA